MKDFLLHNNMRDDVFIRDFEAVRNKYPIYKGADRIFIEKAKADLRQRRAICLYALPFFLQYIKRFRDEELS